MGLWKRRPGGGAGAATGGTGVQTGEIQMRPGSYHPFGALEGYVPLHNPEIALYRAIREAVPVVDAAVMKLVRLTGGVSVKCRDRGAEVALNDFLRTVKTGWNQEGLQSFLDCYLDSLLTNGRAVGEMVLDPTGREIAAILCASVSRVEAKEESPLDFTLCQRREDGSVVALPYQDLLLFTPFHPGPDAPYGVSLLHSMPFLANILLKIYQTLGLNWERAGNVRFSVVHRPGGEGLEPARALERSRQLASEWSAAMQSSRQGAVRDFVSVGDVEIKVIGGECQLPDCQIPVRLIVEQLIAQTGLPPFMLGLNWASTERMSSQQADMMTSELTALRRTLEPAILRICALWLRLHGFDPHAQVVWEEINLQDTVEEARAALFRQQARRLEMENERMEAGV